MVLHQLSAPHFLEFRPTFDFHWTWITVNDEVGALVLSEGRQPRRRHETCDYEKYEHEGKTCCPCPSGFRVLSDCTDKDATKCEMCKLGSFMTHPNRDHTCQPCKTCNPNANMETKKNCSFYSDTVCTCKKYHYCDKGDLCRVCYPCDTCEEHGDVKIPCTETNNTVCRDAQGSDSTGITGPKSPGNVKEQTYNLLEDWYQRQGLKGAYPTLIKTLLHIKEKENAEQIQQIVEKGQATAQPKTDQNV
ncbi:tumor necrosis factor receptor superfamily member 14-like isoform X3 [Myxocyprinus asiaticus]|uniref:tumor necrosis factor receptor superfamily member 14-like isoform X3 n=1 Tax=Myxocyprinus asiaticus TaxID=70543 RepID=UPI0022218DA4|nr:tumor necrosis factor receptor superfamily member 14-like isoform X3 [Myxocyprinus asiaticus]